MNYTCPAYVITLTEHDVMDKMAEPDVLGESYD